MKVLENKGKIDIKVRPIVYKLVTMMIKLEKV